jgi:hypothetical protein
LALSDRESDLIAGLVSRISELGAQIERICHDLLRVELQDHLAVLLTKIEPKLERIEKIEAGLWQVRKSIAEEEHESVFSQSEPIDGAQAIELHALSASPDSRYEVRRFVDHYWSVDFDRFQEHSNVADSLYYLDEEQLRPERLQFEIVGSRRIRDRDR